MAVPEKIRNVVLVGHGGSGKTSLAEAILYVAGATNRLGSVDEGTTVFDSEPEEIEKKISLSLGVASCQWNDHKINLLDAPGFADFAGDARSAFRAADLALFVVSGVDGVEVQTEILWKVAGEEGLPRAIFVNKLDRERSSFPRVLDELRAVFGKRVAPVQIPVGAENGLRGITRVVTNRTYVYSPGDKTGTLSPTPPDQQGEVDDVHTSLIESVVETDDAMMEKYFEGQEPTAEQIVSTVHRGMLGGELYPVLVGSATRLIGVDTLAEFLVDFGPSPLERAVPPLESGVLDLKADGPTAAYVFKTVSDPFVGRISMFRVFSGSIKVDDEVEIARGGRARFHNLFYLQGKDHTDAKQVVTGEIAAVAKIDVARVGDTLRSAGSGVSFSKVSYPRPVMELAVRPHSTHDEDKLSTALQRIVEEDPTLAVDRRAATSETVLSGLGDVHLDVTVARIARKFGVAVDTQPPKIPYRETISASTEAEGKHKKQSGGRGQFGVCSVRFSPRPRGSGYEFIDAIKGGSIPRQFIPAVDKGIQEALERGILAGYPVVDVSAAVFDGKYHSVDSDEMSFRMAGIMAVKAAAPQLRPALLEPIMRLVARVPEEQTGDVMGDINAKRGRVLGMDSEGNTRVITAEVPMAEVQRYAIDLRSITSGRGTFEVTFDHYAEMPHQEAQKIVAAAKADGS